MKKVVLTYGLIAGLMVACFMIVTFAAGVQHLDSSMGMIIGFLGMIVAFSFIFIGIKKYRDQFNGGVVSFGKAFQIGILITLIASTMYVITWLIEYNFIIPDFMDNYAANHIAEMKAAGESQAVIDKTAKEMAEFKEMYKNPLINAMFTYMEILPVGLLMTTIASLVLKRTSRTVA